MLAISGAEVDQIASKLAPTKAGPYFSRCRPGRGPAAGPAISWRHAYATADGYRSDQGLSIRRAGMRGDSVQANGNAATASAQLPCAGCRHVQDEVDGARASRS